MIRRRAGSWIASMSLRSLPGARGSSENNDDVLMPILLATIIMSGLGFGLVLPGFLFMAERLGASPAMATSILAMYSVGQFVSTPVWGRLSDRYGRKPILVGTMFGQVIANLLIAFSADLWMLALGRGLSGLLAGLAPALAYVADVTPPEKRAQGMGSVGAAMSTGFMVGPALGGLMGGADAASATLLWPGLLAGGIALLTAIGGLLFLKESLPAEKRAMHHATSRGDGRRATLDILRRPALVQFVVLGLLVYTAMAMFETIFPLWSNRQFAWGPREVGISFTYLSLVVGVSQGLLVGRLVPVLGEGRIVMGALIAYAVGLVLMTEAPTWPFMMFGITLTAGGGAFFVTTMSSLVSRQAGAGEQGLVLGTYQSASWLGRCVGPPISGLLFKHWGLHSPLLAAALLMLPCLAVLTFTLSRSGVAQSVARPRNRH
jgi:MFS family permease